MFRALLIHTADSSRLAFAAEAAPVCEHVSCEHLVKEDWLVRARRSGIGDASLRDDIFQVARTLAPSFDVIMCTCSTLGPVFDALDDSRFQRADRAMMQLAANSDGAIILAYCLDSTADPSTRLLRECLHDASSSQTVIDTHCDGAWRFFEANDPSAYADAITLAVARAAQAHPEVGCIVLAQGSMAIAQEPLTAQLDLPVLCAPPIAVGSLVEQAIARSA